MTYGSEVWVFSKTDEKMMQLWEKKILRNIYGSKQEEKIWLRGKNQEFRDSHIDINFVRAQRIG